MCCRRDNSVVVFGPCKESMVIEISLVVVWALLQIPLGMWLFRGKPPKEILNQYPKVLVFQSTIPYLKKWRGKINPSHLKFFEEYRRRVFIQYYGCFVAPILIFLVYLYLRYIYLSS